MKWRLLISGAAVLLIVVAVFAGQRSRGDSRSSDAPPGATQWEYLIVAGGNANLSTEGNDQYSSMRKVPDGSFNREWFPLERNLDKLGAKGWELVWVGGPPNGPVFYFKRPKDSSR